MALTPELSPALREDEQRAEAFRRLSLLAATGSLLGVSLDTPTLLARIADLLVPSFADWCAIDLLSPDGSISRVATKTGDTASAGSAHKLAGYSPDPIGTHPVLEVLSTGRSMLLTELPDEILQRAARDEVHLAAMRAMEPRSGILVPLAARGKTLGTILAVTSRSRRVYDTEDLRTLEDVAHRVALAIDNARLFSDVNAAEQRYRALVESLDAIVYEFDAASRRFTFANDRVETLLGYPRERWIRERDFLANVLHPEDREWVLAAHADGGGEQTQRELEYRMLAADGRTVWVHESVNIERDTTGRLSFLRGLVVDITERKRRERNAQAEDEILRVFAQTESLNDIPRAMIRASCEALGWDTGSLWRVEPATNHLRCVDTWSDPDMDLSRFEALTMRMSFPAGVGLPGRVWAAGTSIWVEDVARDQNLPRAATAAAEGLRSAIGFPVVAGGRTLGVIEFFSKRARRRDEDLLSLMMSIGAQVGQFIERRAAEEAAREAQARARAILESSLDAVLTMDARGLVVEFNPAAERLFGYSREAAIGKPVEPLIVPPSMRDRHRKGIERYLATREARILNRRMEVPAMRADGSEFPAELTIVRVDAPGEPVFTGFIRDISDRIAAERHRQAQYATTRAIADSDGIEEASTRIASAICDALGWCVGVTWLVDGDVMRECGVYEQPGSDAGEITATTRAMTFARGEGVPGEVWASGEPAWMQDLDGISYPRAAVARATGMKTWLAFPIRASGTVLGVLEFFSDVRAEPGDEAVQLLGSVGAQLGQFIVRKRAELDVRFQKALLESQNRSTIDGIVITDTDGKVLSFNDRFREMWQVPPEISAADTDGLSAHVFAQLKDPDTFRERAAELQRHPDEPDREEIEVRDGRTFDRFSAPLRSDDGARVGRAWYFRDITESRQTRAALAGSSRRFAFLAEASSILVGSLDQWLTMTNLARLVVPYLADWCVIDVVQGDGTVRRAAVNHSDPEMRALVGSTDTFFELDPDAERGAHYVIRTGRSQFEPEIKDEWLVEAVGHDPEMLELVRSMGFHSYMCLPLQARGRSIGALTLITAGSGRVYGEEDLALAEDLARRASLAVDNARLYAEQQHVARTLQESLLPRALPEIAGVELSARYHAAGEAVRVGGDLYDAFDAEDGKLVVVMGDVCGKGPEAAALTALTRHTVRAAALQTSDPERMLEILNDALNRQPTNDRFCTVALGVLDPATTTIRLACGGHPFPLVLRADGTVEAVGKKGMLLGVFDDVTAPADEVRLGPGDAVVFYTDGLTEARSPDGEVIGEEGLRDLVRAAAGQDAASIAARLEREAIDFQHGTPRDDIAVLVVRIAPDTGAMTAGERV